MSFTAIKNDAMDFSITKNESVELNETTMSSKSPPPEEQDSGVRHFPHYSQGYSLIYSILHNKFPALTPTPKKRSCKENTTTAAEDQGSESPTKKTKIKSPHKALGLGPIPTSYEEASDEDKLLIRMKEIERALEEITSTNLGAGLHVRMKANLVVFQKGDVCFLPPYFGSSGLADIHDKSKFSYSQRKRSKTSSRQESNRRSRTLLKSRLITIILLPLYKRSTRS